MRKSGQADTRGLCIHCKSINSKFDDVFSADYMCGIMFNDVHVVCSLCHIAYTRYCFLCKFFRSLPPKPFSSFDHLFLSVRWAKAHLHYVDGLDKTKLHNKEAWQIVPHDPVVLEVSEGNDGGLMTLKRHIHHFMEQGTQESSNKITVRRVDHRVNYRLIRSWLSLCREHHQGRCHTGLDGVQDIPGFRVIDCASRKIILLTLTGRQ